MKSRVLFGVVSLLLGVGLIAWVFSQRGPPWGFRDRAVVVVESVGAVEITAGQNHPGSATGDTLRGAEVAGLFFGDEIRTGPLSLVKLKTPDLTFQVGGGSQLRLDDDGGITLTRGSMTLDVPRSERVVRIKGGGGAVAFDEGSFNLVADGRAGNLFVLVKRGKANALNGTKTTPLSTGDLLKMSKGASSISDVRTDVGLRVACRRAPGAGKSRPREVSGQAPPGTLLLVDGRLLYPANDSSFALKLPPDDTPVVVFARAPGGASVEKTLACR